MKKHISFIAMALLVTSCIEQSKIEEPSALWNGYFHFFKSGEVIHTLWAGKYINIGTVTYGIDDQANFYATYDCSSSGWLISETHLFAGDKAQMPLNKPGAPKIGKFPCSGSHNPRVNRYTYRIPLSQLPPCAEPGFVVAAHCVAHSPYGQTETAWAEGDYTFSDKGWGWYDTYFYTPPAEENNILYGTVYTLDSLIIYHIDINTGASQVILTEFVGNTAGTYDGAAYDNESGLIFFTNYQTNQLWANDLNGEEPSFCTGTLSGTSASGTFYDGAYYYINEDLNTINQVLFDDLWQIISEITLDTIPGLITITDIAMDPTGNFLYMTGTVNGNDSELIAWEPETGAFYTLSLDISGEMQIAFGNDGNLYGIAPLFSDDDGSGIYVIHLDEDTLMEIEAEAIVLIDDPFTDLTRGPTW